MLNNLARIMVKRSQKLTQLRAAYFTQCKQWWIRHDDITAKSTTMTWAYYSMVGRINGLMKEVDNIGEDAFSNKAPRWAKEYAGLAESVNEFGLNLNFLERAVLQRGVKI